MQRNPFSGPRGPVQVDITLPTDMGDDEVREVLAKALRYPVEPSLRQAAAQDAAELRAEFTQQMRGFFANYEDHYNALDQLRRAEMAYGKRPEDRAEQIAVIDQRIKRLKDRTAWMFRSLTYRYYRDQFMLGKTMAGNARPLDRAETERLRRVANAEAQFGLNALLDAETGEYFMDLTERGGLYGNAVDEMKWYGFLYADLSPGRYVKWIINPAEHCIDCMWLAGKLEDWIADMRAHMRPDGPTPRQERELAKAEAALATQGGRWGTGVYTAQELSRMAIVPQSGKLACTTNCKCHLEECAKPAGQPVHEAMAQPWKSLSPKKKTMDKRHTKPRERRRLSKLESRWADEHVTRRRPAILGKEVYDK